MMYRLDNSFRERDYMVVVAGCGGTGGFTAEGLCRILQSEARLLLVDPDRVEERNLQRQNFFREDMGELKSEALARRLARKYHRPVAYSVYPVAQSAIDLPGLVIGCVDNGSARRQLAELKSIRPYSTAVSWWIDAGNGENYGQILIGNVRELHQESFNKETGLCYGLPLPTIQRPDLLAQAPPHQPDCADAPEQGPTINQMMAAWLIEVVRRVIEGTCPWMQLYIDVHSGHVQPVYATPENANRFYPKKNNRR
ncbi:MAG: ThiF family adenylyltransferase [Chloroflexi bacterium]|nr:ThiF family adenylyltransferase [Chloroflexota bacterium]